MMIDLTSLGQFDFGTNWSFTPPPPGPSQIDLPETRWVVPPSKEATAAYIAQADPRTAIPLLEQMGYRKIDSTEQTPVRTEEMETTGPPISDWTDWSGWGGLELIASSPITWILAGGALWLLTRK